MKWKGREPQLFKFLVNFAIALVFAFIGALFLMWVVGSTPLNWGLHTCWYATLGIWFIGTMHNIADEIVRND